jgi:hypothetical protein
MTDRIHTHLGDMLDAFYYRTDWPATIDPDKIWAVVDRLSEEQRIVFRTFWQRDGIPTPLPSFAAGARALEISRSRAWTIYHRVFRRVVYPMHQNRAVYDRPIRSPSYGYA